MKILVLSGVGGSSNWLPLVLPLDGLVLVIYSIDFLIKYIKKRKLDETRERKKRIRVIFQ